MTGCAEVANRVATISAGVDARREAQSSEAQGSDGPHTVSTHERVRSFADGYAKQPKTRSSTAVAARPIRLRESHDHPGRQRVEQFGFAAYEDGVDEMLNEI